MSIQKGLDQPGAERSGPLHTFQLTLPQPPQYDFTNVPVSHGFRTGVDNPAVEAKSRPDFHRSAKWCPDGTAALAITESRKCRVFAKESLPQSDPPLQAAVWPMVQESAQPSAIWSSMWYPYASLANPATFCYVLGVANGPVRLVDGNTGQVRASYAIIDHSERFVAPSSLCFNGDASRLYCGFESAIEIFDFNRPGSEGVRMRTTPSRKSRDGQKGVISALSFSPDGSGTFAAGSYSGTIGIYSEESGEDRLAEVYLGEASSGVTQLSYHPSNPHILYAASRMSDHIAGYDMRNLNAGPFVRLHRPGRTQQRLSFDIDWAGRYLATGGTDGILRIYDIGSPTSEELWHSQLQPDIIGSVSMHPFEPTLLAACGSRRGLSRAEVASADRDLSVDSDTEDSSTGYASDSTASGSLLWRQDDPAPHLGLTLTDLSGVKPSAEAVQTPQVLESES